MPCTAHYFYMNTLVTSRCIHTTMYSHSHTSHNSHHSASYPQVHLSLQTQANFYELLVLSTLERKSIRERNHVVSMDTKPTSTEYFPVSSVATAVSCDMKSQDSVSRSPILNPCHMHMEARHRMSHGQFLQILRVILEFSTSYLRLSGHRSSQGPNPTLHQSVMKRKNVMYSPHDELF